jgi:hypothetical protein
MQVSSSMSTRATRLYAHSRLRDNITSVIRDDPSDAAEDLARQLSAVKPSFIATICQCRRPSLSSSLQTLLSDRGPQSWVWFFAAK